MAATAGVMGLPKTSLMKHEDSGLQVRPFLYEEASGACVVLARPTPDARKGVRGDCRYCLGMEAQ